MSTQRSQPQADDRPQALVYCRVSTRGQAEDGTSLDSQEAACVQHAESLGFAIGRVTREVYSGAELWDRPQLSHDREDLKTSRFAALVCYSTDRLSRDPIHLAIIAQECQRAGVELIFVSEPVDTSDEGQLIQYVKGYANKLEREKIRERHLRGKHARVLSGKLHRGGTDLYGYRRDKERGVRIIHEPEAVMVRQIYEWCAVERLGILTIANRLNERGVPSPSTGKRVWRDPERVTRWHKSAVVRLLEEPAYKGETILWRTQRPASKADRLRPNFDKERAALIRPESEWVPLPEGVTPPLVTPELWEAAQETLRDRKAALATRNAARPYLLRGMVWCSVCGKRMYGSIENSPTGHRNHVYSKTRIYRCSSRHGPSGACGGKRVPADPAEAWVWEHVRSVLEQPDLIAQELKRQQEEGPDATLVADLETACREAARCERMQADLLQRYTASNGGEQLWQLVDTEIRRLEVEKAQWAETVADLESRLAQQELSTHQLEALYAYCERVRGKLDGATFEEKRLALEALEIRVSGNGREWTLYGRIPGEDIAAPNSGYYEHNISTLCPPLAATSSARFTCSCPRTSARSNG